MNDIHLYKELFGLQNALTSQIQHDDAMVAFVYVASLPNGERYIIKISSQPQHHWRELYFLTLFSDNWWSPKIVDYVNPDEKIKGAILMEAIPGSIIKIDNFTDSIAYDAGAILAQIHSTSFEAYGDCIKPKEFTSDPRVHFSLRFKEALTECENHLPQKLLDLSQQYYDLHIDLLLEYADGPCITHRDFRPGNIIVHNGALQGIIDWASGRASFAPEDFCTLEHTEWPINTTSKKSFLDGYASIRKIPDYKEILPLMRIYKALATIGFLKKPEYYAIYNENLYRYNLDFLLNFFHIN